MVAGHELTHGFDDQGVHTMYYSGIGSGGLNASADAEWMFGNFC